MSLQSDAITRLEPKIPRIEKKSFSSSSILQIKIIFYTQRDTNTKIEYLVKLKPNFWLKPPAPNESNPRLQSFIPFYFSIFNLKIKNSLL